MNVDYYLVSAARRSYRLKTGRPYCFGREEGVDILVQDALASRRHAEVRWHADGYWQLVDLKSRNGVLVNNQRITDPTRIDDGCQIQIGGQVYRMHLLPPGGDPGSLGNQAPQISTLETMGPGFNIADLSTQGATFTGEVTGSLLDLLQFFQTTAKSGRLDLVGGSSICSVHLEKGTPFHAVFGKIKGMEALVEMSITPPPRFAFHAEAAQTGERSLQGSGAGILMEVARMLDEKKK